MSQETAAKAGKEAAEKFGDEIITAITKVIKEDIEAGKDKMERKEEIIGAIMKHGVSKIVATNIFNVAVSKI